MSETLLVVDDEPRIRRIVEMALEDRGYSVLTAASAEEAQDLLAHDSVDVIVADLQLPGRSGLEWLADLRREHVDLPFILITAYGTVESAVEAIKAGAYDYVLKPFGVEELEALIAGALEARHSETETTNLGESGPPGDAEGIVARSPAMAQVLSLVDQVADQPTTVLVTGETGVGKELVARALHQHSSRRDNPFVAVNCAAIPSELLEAELFGASRGAYTGSVKDRPGKVEVAEGGTLFLDEIGDMPLALQPKLLRVLEEGTVERLGSNLARQVDVRVVAATHRDLAALGAQGRFRRDLLYRINVFPIHIPPLRDRPEDIEHLVRLALDRFGTRLGVNARMNPGVLDRLLSYGWPGNVRELLNILERAAILSDDGLIEDVELPFAGSISGETAAGAGPVVPLSDAVASAERAAIQAALDRTGGNKARAARLLGISVRTLWYKLEKLGLR